MHADTAKTNKVRPITTTASNYKMPADEKFFAYDFACFAEKCIFHVNKKRA